MSTAPREPVVDATCSRAGCRAAASWRVDWRNPRIHSADRTKTWVACDEHRDYLRDFLAARDCPVAVAPLDPARARPRAGDGDTLKMDASDRRDASPTGVFASGTDPAGRPGTEGSQ